MKLTRPVRAVLMLGGLAAVAIVGLVCIHPGARLRKTVKPTANIAHPESAPELRALEDLSLKDRAKAVRGYDDFIASHKASASPQVQDQVGVARMREAYLLADQKHFEDARKTFVSAAKEYKGTGAQGAFGGLKDGAEYQAAVCLMAEGKNDEARSALVAFLNSEPLSPLARAAYRRLVRLNGGKSRPEDEALLSKAVALQEKKAAADMVSCGPKALGIFLRILNGPTSMYVRAEAPPPVSRNSANRSARDPRPETLDPSMETLTKLAGTDNNGTSMEGMREALKHFGIKSYGVVLDKEDFLKVQLPAIMFRDGHYTVVTKVAADSFTYIDPI